MFKEALVASNGDFVSCSAPFQDIAVSYPFVLVVATNTHIHAVNAELFLGNPGHDLIKLYSTL